MREVIAGKSEFWTAKVRWDDQGILLDPSIAKGDHSEKAPCRDPLTCAHP